MFPIKFCFQTSILKIQSLFVIFFNKEKKYHNMCISSSLFCFIQNLSVLCHSYGVGSIVQVLLWK